MSNTARARLLQALACGLAWTLLLTGCGEESGPEGETLTIERLSGPTWQLLYMDRAGTRTAIPRETTITLRVGANGHLGGRSGVNRYFGQLKTQKDGSVAMDMGAIASTRMAGPPHLMELEQAYLSALATVSRARRTSDTLTLQSTPDAPILHFLASE